MQNGQTSIVFARVRELVSTRARIILHWTLMTVRTNKREGRAELPAVLLTASTMAPADRARIALRIRQATPLTAPPIQRITTFTEISVKE